MNPNEQPPFEPSRTQGPENQGRRKALRAAAGLFGAGVLAALGKKVIEDLSEDPKQETVEQSLEKLLQEMERSKLSSIPTIETTGNENLLSAAGWVRLEKIMEEEGIARGGGDKRITFEQLQEILNRRTGGKEEVDFKKKTEGRSWDNVSARK